MLKQRIITALLLAPVVLAIIWYANALVFSLFVSFLAFMVAFEWCQIVKKSPINSLIISAFIALSLLLLPYASFIEISAYRIVLAALLLWAICLKWLFNPESGKDKYTIKYALGVGILLLFGASLIAIHNTAAQGAQLTLVLFFLVWIADIGAYVSGKSFGKHKLAPKVSPGKTIEGVIGALLFTSIYGFFMATWLQLPWLSFVIVFPMLTIVSIIGDLFASLIKRHGQIKDSGFLLPGHGGFLDRFDSLIAITPFYFAFLHFLNIV